MEVSAAGYVRVKTPEPARASLCPTRERCKTAAKRAFDVLCLIGGLSMIGVGTVFLIGERAGAAPNRGGRIGTFALGLLIAYGNYTRST